MKYDKPDEIAIRQAEVGDGVDVDIPLSINRVLANFKLHLDLFEAEDYDAGVWAYQQIASKMLEETTSVSDVHL